MSIEESDASTQASRKTMSNNSESLNANDGIGAGNTFASENQKSTLVQQNDLPTDGEVIQAASFAPLQGKVKKQSRKIKPLHIAVGATLFVLAGVALYLFTAKSVYFVVEPANSTVAVTEGFAIPVGEGFLMHSGTYQINVVAEGYHSLDQSIDIDNRQNQTIDLVLQKLPGQLTVVSNADEAGIVRLNGEALGSLNTKIDNIEPGEYRLSIETERYLPFRDVVTIEGKAIHQTQDVSLEPAWADVTITTTPPGANISVDGEIVGQTPLVANILQGERELNIKLAGYKSWQQSIDVFAGNAVTLDPITLDKADGLVTVNTNPSAASITVNGQYYGQTPMELALAPGERYQITFFKEGYQATQRNVSVESGREQTIDVRLDASLGKVAINANPEDALLYVDGRLLGRANQQLSLPAKQTTITVKKEGYADYNTTILPRPRFSQAIPVRLKTLEEAKWENIKPLATTKAGQQLKLFRPEDSFTMGSSRREQGRRANESLRNVSLTRPFYLGLHEVTNGQFRQFSRQHLSGNVKGMSLDSDKLPVVNVSWQQAALYCNWLSEQEGLPLFYIVEEGEVVGFNPQSHGYRMATEVEWAWAARYENGDMLKYAWGSDLLPQGPNFNIADRNAAPVAGYIQPSYDDGYAVSAPIGSFAPNSKGIFDLAGNVSEWLNDFYEVTSSLSQKTKVDPIGPTEGSFHVIRGSSWAHGGTTELRLSFRDYGEEARNDVGFRIARFVE